MEDNQPKYLISLKISIMGGDADGKTSISTRYVDNKFRDFSPTTLVMDSKVKSIKFANHNIKLFIFDLPGRERFRTFFYKDADGFIFVFDIKIIVHLMK